MDENDIKSYGLPVSGVFGKVHGEAPSRPVRTSAVVITKNGAKRIERCLESLSRSGFADEIVVCVDESTTDNTAELAKRFTPHVRPIHVERSGNIEGLLRQMTACCSGDLILRLDDDECLGGDWNRERILSLALLNDVTHFFIPRRWIVTPGDRFLSNAPWFPDIQLRLFRNDLSRITWPKRLHENMIVEGRGLILTDRWIDHYDLVLNDRARREAKCATYRKLRPEKPLTNFYLYEDEKTEFLPADAAGFLAALEKIIPLPKVQPSVSAYRPGETIDFAAGGNSAAFPLAGWSIPEPWGTWTDGYRASLRLPLETPIEGPGLLTVESNAFLTAGHPTLWVMVLCEGTRVGEWVISSGKRVARQITIPARVVGWRKEVNLEFLIANPVSPARCSTSDDHRLLGLGVSKLSLVQTKITLAARLRQTLAGTRGN
ncbi:MAG: glycosyltransferase [Chthoniobacteraceae bacterium]|nr:glycosyltransferase [Chthoniobacteraceae bacterium]